MLQKCVKIVWVVVVAAWAVIVSADDDQRPSSSDGQGLTEHVDVWYVTIRNSETQRSAGDIYGGLRGEQRMGICSMTFTQIPAFENIADSAPFYIPDERIKLHHVNESTRDRFWGEIDAFAQSDDGKIVFYIHGYNVGFEKSCRRAAILQRSLNPRHRLLLFSWPADGNLLSYTRDEADLVWSVPQLADLLQKLAQCVGPERLDVVAHSLGARGVVLALSRMACKPSVTPLINELILIAPDIDKDHFLDAWPRIRPLVRGTTLYASENDRALSASHEAHGYPRLGEAGKHLTVLAGIETVDVSPAGKRRFSGHIYHLYHPAVAADLQMLLNTGRPADRRPNLKREKHQGSSYWRLFSKDP
jgi:esterase/lipase superfamily enzyme